MAAAAGDGDGGGSVVVEGGGAGGGAGVGGVSGSGTVASTAKESTAASSSMSTPQSVVDVHGTCTVCHWFTHALAHIRLIRAAHLADKAFDKVMFLVMPRQGAWRVILSPSPRACTGH